MSPTDADRTDRSARRLPWLALALALLVAAAHLAARACAPAPRFWGDEGHYALLAQADAREGRTSLLPGTLGFEHRPIFGVRVCALFVPRLFAGVTLLNTLLLSLVVLLTCAAGRMLDLSPPAALAAAALLGAFPWLGFHVHSLWPEILHAFFFALVLCGLLAFLRGGSAAWLALAGVASAYALFTKGSLAPFVPFFAVFVALAGARRASEVPPGARALRALAPAAVYAMSVLAVVAPQLVHNARAGYGPHLAANRWWNLEVGLATGETVDDVNQRYWASSPDPLERERLARERTLAHVREVGAGQLLAAQARKLAALVFRKPSELEASLHREARWGDPPPRWLAALELPARALWYALLLLGTLGLALRAARSSGWLLLALFALGYLTALLFVPVKPRFALPLVPVLCLAAGAALEALGARIARAWMQRTAARI
jgi:hypothetical protein